MSVKTGIDVVPVKSAREAVKGVDIVATCTNSIEPVLEGRWLEPGMFVANVTSRELDQEVSRQVSLVGYLVSEGDPLKLEGFTDANFEIRTNVMAYVSGQPEERQRIPAGTEKEITLLNAHWTPCLDWKTGAAIGRQSDKEITVLAELAGSNSRGLASSGIQGIQFASIAGRACELATARRLGRLLDRQLILQDIPT